ncbi:MAG TPA: Arc family DNA-binding protein [Kiloniellales bacterium]|nr:Arc family DNA-binding protein [Kiloniellales bacterium]
MTVNLSIKNAPDDLVERLRRRAQANHRSLQGECLAILEAAVAGTGNGVRDVLAELRRRGLKTPREAATIVRADRERR